MNYIASQMTEVGALAEAPDVYQLLNISLHNYQIYCRLISRKELTFLTEKDRKTDIIIQWISQIKD